MFHRQNFQSHAVTFTVLLILAFPASLKSESLENLKAGVVKIHSHLEGNRKIGTGVIVRIAKDVAVVVTASHIVEGANRIEVTFFGDSIRSYSAKVLKMKGNDERGLAVLKVESQLPGHLKALEWDRDHRVRGGDPVTLIGHPRIVDTSWAVTNGTITGLSGLDIIFSGASDEGNSGGPLIVNGEVVGIVTQKIGEFGLAVPTTIVWVTLEGWGFRLTQSTGKGSSKSGSTEATHDVTTEEVARLRSELEVSQKQGQAKAAETARLQEELKAVKKQQRKEKSEKDEPLLESRIRPYGTLRKPSDEKESGDPAVGFNRLFRIPHVTIDGKIIGPFFYYCKIISTQIMQCLLFQSTDSKAPLIGVEYFIAKSLARKEVPLLKWNRNFYDHKVEIESGRMQVFGTTESEIKKISDSASKTDGIIFHLWQQDQVIPDGSVAIATSLGHAYKTFEEFSKHETTDNTPFSTMINLFFHNESGAGIGYDIHLQAPHLMQDGTLGGPYHHYCKGVSDQVLQCLLFTSTAPNAPLIGVEYFIGKDLAREEVPLSKWNRNFHDHAIEIATGRVMVLDLPLEKAKAVAEALAKTDGVIYHLWPLDQKVPDGTVTIPTSIGHEFRTE